MEVDESGYGWEVEEMEEPADCSRRDRHQSGVKESREAEYTAGNRFSQPDQEIHIPMEPQGASKIWCQIMSETKDLTEYEFTKCVDERDVLFGLVRRSSVGFLTCISWLIPMCRTISPPFDFPALFFSQGPGFTHPLRTSFFHYSL